MTVPAMGTNKSLGVLLSVLAFFQFACGQVILEVPGYAVLNGTEETSTYTDRVFYSFKSVFYADKPTSENRFLVTCKHYTIGELLTDSFATATVTETALPDGRGATSNGEQQRMSSARRR